MSERPRIAVDASVGVKWFKPEADSAEALALQERAAAGEVDLFAPAHFAHEVLAVVCRHYTPADIEPAWRLLNESGITLVPLTDEVVSEAATQSATLACSFYDALAPAVAVLLDATLVSADAQAHDGFPKVELIGPAD